MKEGSLIAACVAIAVIGTASLSILARGAAPASVSVDDLTGEDAGKYVAVKARVASVADYGSNVKVKLCSKHCVSLVVFQDVAREMKEKALDLGILRSGQAVAAKGILRKWRDELQLVARDWRAVEVIS